MAAELTIEVSDVGAPGTVLMTLDQAFGVEGRDILNDVGASQFALPNTSPQPAPGQLVTFRVDGEVAWTAIIEDDEQVEIAPGEEHDQYTRYTCSNIGALLDDSSIFPARGADVVPTEADRFFAWVSPEYDESTYPVSWTSAVEIAKQDDSTPYWVGYPAANGTRSWVDTDAYWIGSSSGDSTDAPLGVSYFRRTFNVTVGGFYAIQFGAFYYGDLWVDSSHVATTSDQLGLLQHVTIELSPGDHTFAIAMVNVDNGGDNPAGVIMALHPLNNDGTLGASVMHTDSSWSMLAWPTFGQPGMTTGEVLGVVLNEDQARGRLANITWDFDGQLDSNGNPWIGTDHPDVQEGTLFDCATKVGYSVLTFLQELSVAYIDWWVDVDFETGAIVLHVVNKGTRGTASGVTLEPGNLRRLARRRRGRPVCNDALVAWAGGFHRVEHPAHIATYGRVGGFLSLGAQQSIATVEALAKAEMDVFGRPETRTVVEHYATGWPYRPGDTLTVPDRTGAPQTMRVEVAGFTQDDEGDLVVAAEFLPTG